MMQCQEQKISSPPVTNKIHVTGFPIYTQPQDFTRVFSEYGEVTLDRLTKKFATLSFRNENDAQAAIDNSNKVVMYGEFLTVKPFQAHLEGPTTPKKEYPRTQLGGEIVSPFRIDLTGEFLQQVDNILAAIRLTQEEILQLGQLYNDVERVLQLLWPGCKAIPFGSVTTGLGIKNSDADCYVCIPRELRHPNVNYVIKAKRILQLHTNLFTEIIPIPRANTPIIKFFHIPTERNCDVTFKTPLGTQNSKLIAFLLQADPRLIPLALIIKYWAKVHGVSGTGKLTNYGLIMMIIFYLQQPPLSILPSIRWLQRSPVDEYIIDFWNAGFMGYKDQLPRITNNSSVLELLGGFFEYYSTFSFEDTVICPYLGRPIKKQVFAITSELWHEFERYKFNVERKYALPLKFTTPMCVQDPIEQSHNVASSVSYKLAGDLQEFFKFAASAYEQDKHLGSKHFLRTILQQKPRIVRVKPSSTYKVHISLRDVAPTAESEWKAIAKEFVEVIFEDIMKVTLYKLDEKFSDTQKEKLKFVGTLNKSVWKRKQFSRLYGIMSYNFVEKQARITEEIMKVDKTLFELKFQLMATFYAEPKLGLALDLVSGDADAFRDFGRFFIGTMPSWFRALLRPHAKPPAVGAPVEVVDATKNIDATMDTSSDSDDDSPQLNTKPKPNGVRT
ncbi:speckle targeted PIP5K1A-regulated poly(A) polymerase-like [Battus philenor]|uniref:speckle targeted PIP5K1A-regulated poly(A) polymerase-like n=1 Tax=Battus philenor TaxID=42288 RepID=UPI0035D0CB32